jgi:hypothetical protein
LFGGDRKTLSKELAQSWAMTGILAEHSEEKQRVGEALIRQPGVPKLERKDVERRRARARSGDQRWIAVR